jgi:hypothetical protein
MVWTVVHRTNKARQSVYFVMPEDGRYIMGPYATREEATKVCATLNGAV